MQGGENSNPRSIPIPIAIPIPIPIPIHISLSLALKRGRGQCRDRGERRLADAGAEVGAVASASDLLLTIPLTALCPPAYRLGC